MRETTLSPNTNCEVTRFTAEAFNDPGIASLNTWTFSMRINGTTDGTVTCSTPLSSPYRCTYVNASRGTGLCIGPEQRMVISYTDNVVGGIPANGPAGFAWECVPNGCTPTH